MRRGDAFFIAMAALLLAAAMAPDATLLQYDRAGLLNGQWWRLWSGHLVHIGNPHLLLNLCALIFLRFLFGPFFSSATWLTATLLIMPAIGLALLWTLPELQWYRGFSGVLHALAALALSAGPERHTRLTRLLLAALWVKVLTEHVWGGAGAVERWIAAPVITQAHFFGVCAAGAGALLLRTYRAGIGFFTRAPAS